MIRAKTYNRNALRLPQLAVTALICWSLGANTQTNVTNTLAAVRLVPSTHEAKATTTTIIAPVIAATVPEVPAGSVLPKNMQVLSSKDAYLYRSLMTAQAKGDWNAADTIAPTIEDKRLMGHVLADRYLRQNVSAADLKTWLASYADLPEAADIYDKARQAAEAQKSAIPHPTTANLWSGTDSYGSSFGFKTDTSDDKPTPAAQRLISKINTSLRHGEPYAAQALLKTEQIVRVLSADELAVVQSRIAAAFFYDGEILQARAMSAAPASNQNPLALWINGLCAWQQGDVVAAGQSFAKLAIQPDLAAWDRSAAQYWAYRALKHSGDVTQANYWLKQAAQQSHSFYGIMANNLLGRNTSWSWQLPPSTDQTAQVLARYPAGWRALALLQIGKASLAESELRHLNPQGQRDLQEAMLSVAEAAHMPGLAIQLGGIATNDNGKPYDAALYPLPPWQPEQGFQIDRALLFALMRHESQFDPTAVSDRGACGLMQLMPTTARLMANDNVESRADDNDCSEHLLDPAHNMGLGQKYVQRLASQPIIGNNLVLLLAAYNSGPNKLARWIDNAPKNDPLFFVESLPVRETRDYVQHVLTHYWTYRARLSESQTSLAELAHGQWPRYALRDEATTGKLASASAFFNEGFEVASNQP